MRGIPGLAIAIACTAAMLGLLMVGGCGSQDPDPQGAGLTIRVEDASGAVSAEVDHAGLHPSHDPQAPCTCATAKLHNHWCRRCNVGYVAGHPVENATLFGAVDPHGHQVSVESLRCESCQLAVRTNGFCEVCRVGFVNRVAYFTRLTHGLAQGQAIDPTSLTCAACQSHAGRSGWCERCNRGMVGNVAIADREAFDRTAKEYRVLLAAIDRSGTCELCACAMVVHSTCPRCRIKYARADPEPQPEIERARSPQQH